MRESIKDFEPSAQERLTIVLHDEATSVGKTVEELSPTGDFDADFTTLYNSLNIDENGRLAPLTPEETRKFYGGVFNRESQSCTDPDKKTLLGMLSKHFLADSPIVLNQFRKKEAA